MAALRVYLGGDTQYVSGTVNGTETVWTLSGENLWQTDATRPPDDRYVIHLEAYDFLGRMTAYDWTGYYGDGALIWHHTRLDYLNAEDLNRIETATAFLRDRLAEHSYLVDMTCRTDWSCTDFPTRGEIDRIRRNIDALQAGFYRLPDWREIMYNNTLDAAQINAFEWDLHALGVWLDRMVAAFVYSGEIYSGEDY